MWINVQEELNERVAKLEGRVDNHERSIQSQIDKNESLIKLTAIMELQTKSNEKQNVQLEKFGETLNRVDINLTNLNNSQQQLQKEVVAIGSRVEVIEQKADENKLDPFKLFLKVLGWVGGIFSALFIAYLAYKFGWNNN